MLRVMLRMPRLLLRARRLEVLRGDIGSTWMVMQLLRFNALGRPWRLLGHDLVLLGLLLLLLSLLLLLGLLLLLLVVQGQLLRVHHVWWRMELWDRIMLGGMW